MIWQLYPIKKETFQHNTIYKIPVIHGIHINNIHSQLFITHQNPAHDGIGTAFKTGFYIPDICFQLCFNLIVHSKAS